jgi:hypothetical protein
MGTDQRAQSVRIEVETRYDNGRSKEIVTSNFKIPFRIRRTPETQFVTLTSYEYGSIANILQFQMRLSLGDTGIHGMILKCIFKCA